jgi:ribonuclease T2
VEDNLAIMPPNPPQLFANCVRAALVIASLAGLSFAAAARDQKAGKFDYYVLALSWSPTYCAGDAGQNDFQQCAPGRKFAFVVHGLWPQYNRGWPQDCPTRENWVEQEQIDGMMDIMPSKRLIIHEWKKHGTCSGLSQEGYFSAVRRMFDQVRIPARYLSPQADVAVTSEQLVTDFVKSNRGLTSRMLSVQCGNGTGRARLSELRICVDKSGVFAACGVNEKRQCRAETLVLPPVK